MKTKRASLSKRTRFAIFERDSFTCQYCGKRPPETVLQLDHIHPVSKGGHDTEDNLVTSCVECNAGKTDRLLGTSRPWPDSDLRALAAQQEIAEAERYLEIKQRRDLLYEHLASCALDSWDEQISSYHWRPTQAKIIDWILTYGPEAVDDAVRISARKAAGGSLSRDGAIRYCASVLYNHKDDNA